MLNGYRVSAGMVKNSEDRWWQWLHNNVSELYMQKKKKVKMVNITMCIFYYNNKEWRLDEVCIVVFLIPNSNLLIFREKVHTKCPDRIMPAGWYFYTSFCGAQNERNNSRRLLSEWEIRAQELVWWWLPLERLFCLNVLIFSIRVYLQGDLNLCISQAGHSSSRQYSQLRLFFKASSSELGIQWENMTNIWIAIKKND